MTRGRSVTLFEDGRAISDALGFVFVFAIITTMVGVVYIAGFESLGDARQFERMNNAERAFDVLADNVEDITHRGAPSRATEIKLDEAALNVGDTVTVNVSVERSADSSKNGSFEFTIHPIVFEASQDNAMVYTMGAVFRESDTGAAMTYEPGMVLGSDRLVLPVIQTRPLSKGSIAGSTTALVRTEYSTSSVLFENTTASDVTVNITSPRAEAWRLYFETSGDATCDPAVNTDTFASCEMTGIDRVYVTRIAIDFEFIQ